MYQFGSGIVYINPITVSGVSAPNPTPIQVGTLQDCSLDIALTVKELYGRNRFADDAQTAQAKISGKLKFGRINSKAMLESMFGAAAALAAGGNTLALDEAGTIPAVSTFTITVTNSAHFVDDLGVKYANTGVALVKVATSPAAGQYSVAAGVYTFAAADASGLVKISYTFSTATATLATAVSTTLSNSGMGLSPRVLLYLFNTNAGGQQLGVKLFSAIVTKLSLPTKNEDYTIAESDFTGFADAAGRVMEWDGGE
jgi:hypothetical protein